MAATSNKVPVTLRDYFFKDPHFASTWDHYDKLKENILKVSDDLWQKFYAQLRSMKSYVPMVAFGGEGEVATQEKTFPRNWMVPHIPGLESEKEALDLFNAADPDIIRFKEDKDSLLVSLDVHLYRPSEMHIAVSKDRVNVSGKHEETLPEHKGTVIRQFQRIYTLPAGLTKEDVTCDLSADGVLVITAQKNKKAVK